MSSNGLTVRSFSVLKQISVSAVTRNACIRGGVKGKREVLSPSSSMYIFRTDSEYPIAQMTFSSENMNTNRVAFKATDVDPVTAGKLYTDLLAAMHGTNEITKHYGDHDEKSD